jgi:hypothetical protein
MDHLREGVLGLRGFGELRGGTLRSLNIREGPVPFASGPKRFLGTDPPCAHNSLLFFIGWDRFGLAVKEHVQSLPILAVRES